MALSRTAVRLLAVSVALSAAVGGAAPALAQITGNPLEISAGAGVFAPDARASVKKGPAYKGAIGYRFLPAFTLEGQATFAPSKADTGSEPQHNFSMYGLDLRWNLRDADSRALPFLLAGAGYGLSHDDTANPPKLQHGAGTLGIGLLLNALDNQRLYVRLEVRDIMFREREQSEFSHHMGATAGLQWVLRGKVKDQDLDKVRDWLDECPHTPIGAVVNAHGCPTDADGDGVADGIDKCPNTPKGCPVDKDGCSKDTDGDGVCDGIDKCAGTPKGATVDAVGCPADPDSDGVYDGIDQCANTPRGCTVDAKGCPADADGDGVCDGVDVCPNTPTGLKVDARGCPIEVSEMEVQLLDTGMIRLENIQFETRKAVLKPESFARIDEAGGVLQQYPQLKVEIGGHCDNRGSKALNDTLSESRARAVLDYLKQHFPKIPADQYSAKGYGFSKPIAPNTTDAGRARNRRVEFKVLNTGTLRIERNKRRMLKTGESAPAPGTPAPEVPKPTPAPPDTTKR
jgi:outer membrane protein OmpA-like peptidoglycan-associated protein